MISTIRVEMLGGLAVWADDVPVLEDANRVNKPWQLFCLLVLNRSTPVSTARLIESLWAGEALADPGNVLKNTVYALRRDFPDAGDTKESPILFENGCYLCNPAIRFVVDAEQFDEQAKALQGLPGSARPKALAELTELYRGDLLPALQTEVWVIPKARQYKQQYVACVTELCGLLLNQGDHIRLLEVATAASQVDPLEESFYLYIFRALVALEMFKSIIPAYHRAARILQDELGTQPCQEIQDIYALASQQVDLIEQDIIIIKDDLREVMGETGPPTGPLYCSYDVFKYLYQMVARASERAGGNVFVVLLTLQTADGEAPPPKTLSTAMAQIKAVILGGLLRKTDTIARYSKNQYIVMLSIEQAGGADLVMERIRTRCTPVLADLGVELMLATTKLETGN